MRRRSASRACSTLCCWSASKRAARSRSEATSSRCARAYSPHPNANTVSKNAGNPILRISARRGVDEREHHAAQHGQQRDQNERAASRPGCGRPHGNKPGAEGQRGEPRRSERHQRDRDRVVAPPPQGQARHHAGNQVQDVEDLAVTVPQIAKRQAAQRDREPEESQIGKPTR